MDLRVYEVLFQFNQAINQALESPNVVEKLGLGSPDTSTESEPIWANSAPTPTTILLPRSRRRSRRKRTTFYCVRRNREKAEEGPNEIYLELKSREELRREQGLPPRAVVLPWTQADDDRILAMQKAASSSLPTQPEQPRIMGDSEQENQKGGSPT